MVGEPVRAMMGRASQMLSPPPPPFSTGSGLGAMPSPADVAALALPAAGDQQLAGVTGAAGVVAMVTS